MSIQLKHVAIVGATGPTGRELAHRLREKGIAVRAVSRSEANLSGAFAGSGVEWRTADALDADAMRAAVDGCDLVVDCIGLPPQLIDKHEATARTIADAAALRNARCLHVSSCWGFLPQRQPVVDETHPREGGNLYVRSRRAAEDVMLGAGAAVVHLPDFFGPHVHVSTLQMPLRDIAAGKHMTWMGSPDTEREYAYVPDAMRIVAELATREEAYGSSWIVPGSGPVSARRIAAIAGDHLGRQIKVRSAPGWLLKALSPFSSDLRAFRPMVDDYLKPVRYDASRLEGLLGPQETTPYEKAVPATLDHLAAER